MAVKAVLAPFTFRCLSLVSFAPTESSGYVDGMPVFTLRNKPKVGLLEVEKHTDRRSDCRRARQASARLQPGSGRTQSSNFNQGPGVPRLFHMSPRREPALYMGIDDSSN